MASNGIARIRIPGSCRAQFPITAILWASALGWLVWGDGLTGHVIAGNALIVASGVVVLRVERLRTTQQNRAFAGLSPPPVP